MSSFQNITICLSLPFFFLGAKEDRTASFEETPDIFLCKWQQFVKTTFYLSLYNLSILFGSRQQFTNKNKTAQVTGGGKSYRYHVDREDLAQVSPEGQVGQERAKVRAISSLQSITKVPQ